MKNNSVLANGCTNDEATTDRVLAEAGAATIRVVKVNAFHCFLVKVQLSSELPDQCTLIEKVQPKFNLLIVHTGILITAGCSELRCEG